MYHVNWFETNSWHLKRDSEGGKNYSWVSWSTWKRNIELKVFGTVNRAATFKYSEVILLKQILQTKIGLEKDHVVENQ